MRKLLKVNQQLGALDQFRWHRVFALGMMTVRFTEQNNRTREFFYVRFRFATSSSFVVPLLRQAMVSYLSCHNQRNFPSNLVSVYHQQGRWIRVERETDDCSLVYSSCEQGTKKRSLKNAILWQAGTISTADSTSRTMSRNIKQKPKESTDTK